jgi:hypothetical protein
MGCSVLAAGGFSAGGGVDSEVAAAAGSEGAASATGFDSDALGLAWRFQTKVVHCILK